MGHICLYMFRYSFSSILICLTFRQQASPRHCLPRTLRQEEDPDQIELWVPFLPPQREEGEKKEGWLPGVAALCPPPHHFAAFTALCLFTYLGTFTPLHTHLDPCLLPTNSMACMAASCLPPTHSCTQPAYMPPFPASLPFLPILIPTLLLLPTTLLPQHGSDGND